jgi:hypothetical protein
MVFAEASDGELPQPEAPVVPRAEQYQAAAGDTARQVSETASNREVMAIFIFVSNAKGETSKA